jgi:transposase
MKFIKPLSEVEKQTLKEAHRKHPQFRARHRAQALLLNARGYTIAQLQSIFEVGRDTVSSWLDHWELDGIVGLLDEVRSGRPPIFTREEQHQFKTYVDENPHQLKEAAARLQEEVGKEASLYTYKRFLKKHTATPGNVVGTHSKACVMNQTFEKNRKIKPVCSNRK